MSSLVTANFLRKEKARVGCQRLEDTWFLVYLLCVPGAAWRLKETEGLPVRKEAAGLAWFMLMG